jgi:hypothetical protein
VTALDDQPKWRLAEGLMVLAVALGCTGFQLWLPTTHVAQADYEAVARVLEAGRQPGDVVLLAPWWTERARAFVPEGLPVVGYLGSDAAALEPHPRIWVLAQPHLPRSNLGTFDEAFGPSRTALGPPRTFGNLRLQLFQNGRHHPVVVDAADALPNAAVYLEDTSGNRQPCSNVGKGYRCADNRVVAKEWHEVHFAPYQCLKLEAPGGNTRVVVEFVSPAADASWLEAGYIWEYGSAYQGVTPSTVWFELDGKAQTVELPIANEVMHRLEGPALAEGARVRIALASANPAGRVVCVVMRGTRKAP